MSVRFRETRSKLQVSLVEPRRVGGKVRQEHVASLGSVPRIPMTTADRIAFWMQLRPRLDKLGNRIGAEQVKILDAVHARIHMVTIDEQRALQRENAEAEAKFWAGLQGMNAEQAEGHKDIAAKSARIAAEAEARATEAAAKAVKAKERLDKLASGEDVTGGLGNPMTWEAVTKILKEAGATAADMRFSMELASLHNEEDFEAFVQQSCEAHHRAEKRSRWKVLRKIIARRATVKDVI